MRNSNTIINYGPTLPPAGSVQDGSVFYVTQGSNVGFHIHRFVSDTNAGALGEQVGYRWETAAALGVNADTLDGHDSTYFQPANTNLDALGSLSTTGFVVRTGVSTFETRSLLVSAPLTLLPVGGGNGVAGNVTIGFDASTLLVSDMGGTLGIAHGGTNNTSVTVGGIAYGTATSISTSSAGVATSGSGTAQTWQVLTSSGAAAPVWVNTTSLNVAHAVTAASATVATTANGVTWTNVTSKPTTLSGFGITDALTTTQTNTADYLNFSPFAGTLKDNKVPVYADFPFSQGRWNTPTFTWIDRTGKQVAFYDTNTPTGNVLCYRAYRYSDVDAWIYDNIPVSVSFALPTEKVYAITNMGTNFAVLWLGTLTFPLTRTRVVIVKTNGSSDCNDWVFAYDVTALMTPFTTANFGLVPTSSGDRILLTNTASSSPVGTYRVVLRVYDATLTELRTLDLYDSLTMANMTDTTGAGRVSNSAHNAIGLTNYHGLSITYGFTWNPFNETFHQHFNSYFTYDTSTGATIGQPIGLSISFSIPRTWIENGTGTVTNNIPIKSGTYRYNMLSDSTWGTVTGGMASAFVGGANGSLVTDEYSGDMWFTYKGSFTSALAATNVYRYKANSGQIYQTIDANANFTGQYTLGGSIGIPDGSPWSKVLYTYYGHVIGNNILLRANSNRYGDALVQTTFSTTEFASVQAGVTDDTLMLDSAGALINPGSLAGTTWPAAVTTNIKPGNMGTVVVGGVPTYYFCNGGSLVYTVTASGSTRNFTSTGVTMPVVPSAIDALTGVVDQDCVAWNGDVVTPIWWAVVRDNTGMAYMAKNAGGTWSIVSTNMFQAPIDLYSGPAGRNDGLNSIIIPTVSGHPLLTENGRFLFNFSVPAVGGTAWYWGCFDINTNVATHGTLTQFAAAATAPGKYGAVGGYPGSTFGYSTTLGYYRLTATSLFDAAVFVSSIDVRGVGATITEDQWFNNTATRYETWISTESATGLVAYLSAFPIFLGGYYSTMATQSVTLLPSTDNYIYAARNAVDRSVIDVTVSTLQLPSSFSRVLLAKITTDATRIVGQVNYAIAQHDDVEDLANVVVTNKISGDGLVWGGSSWINSQVSSPTQVSSAIAAAVATLQAQLSAVQVMPGSVTWFAGSSAPSGYLVCDGSSLLRTTYAALFAAIGTTHGAVDGTHFNLPDLRGEFIRGADLGRGVDVGRTVGSVQGDLFEGHTHSISGGLNYNISIDNVPGTVLQPNNAGFGTPVTNLATDSTGGTETRPRNVALLPIIKY